MLEAISNAQLLDLWEASGGGSGAPGAGGARRSLALLRAAHPENTSEELAALPLGECHQRLLQLRARLFGDRLESVSSCPECGEELEMGLSVTELLASAAETSEEATAARREVAVDLAESALRLRGRSPTLADLMAIGSEDPERRLLEHCVLEARRHGAPIPAGALEPDEVTELGRRLTEADPWLELWLDLDCGGCGHRFRQLLDPGAYLATELEIAAAQLMRQIHRLARAYGWSEAEILALSSRRRHAYLEQLEL
ncbi:MAG: hypothetical protein SX243_03430 [Acidobacteriota bacterium]|nr:hypothetical protein [Acidobacteriota bacterium]